MTETVIPYLTPVAWLYEVEGWSHREARVNRIPADRLNSLWKETPLYAVAPLAFPAAPLPDPEPPLPDQQLANGGACS